MKGCSFSPPVRCQDIILVVCAIFIIAVGTHIATVHRLAVQRVLFPIEAVLSWHVESCSAEAPRWLKALLGPVSRSAGSLAGQIAYISPSGELVHCQRGWRNGLWSEPVTSETRFRFASTTKVLTADAVLAAANEERLSLDDLLLGYLPEVENPADERLEGVTLRHLLQHTGGFDRLITPDTMFAHGSEPWCPGHISYLQGATLDFDPGTRYAYGNLGYCLLGVVLERVYGEPFRVLMARRYPLADLGLAFLDGPYLADEVHYDFRNSDFYTMNYHRHFHFQALSSSASLSGSASGYARLLYSALTRAPHSLRSEDVRVPCERVVLRSCYGYTFNIYQQEEDGLVAFIQGGNLIGATSLVVVDSLGGVLVWVGNGMPRKVQLQMDQIKERVYRALSNQYAARTLD